MTIPKPAPLVPLPNPTDTACRRDPELFDAYPVKSRQGYVADPTAWERIRAALDLCYSCPVLVDCRKWAAEHRDIHGIVGGEYRPWFPIR